MNLREKQIRPGDRRFDLKSDREESKHFSIREISPGEWEVVREREEMNFKFSMDKDASRRNIYVMAAVLLHGCGEAWGRFLTSPTPI